jgi:Fe-S-cluster containining protein
VSFTPVFRSEISFHPEPNGRLVLRDALLVRELRLDPALAAVSQAVDGRRDLDAVLSAAVESSVTRPLAVRAARTLLLLNVFEGVGADVVEPLRAVRDGLEIPRGAVLPDMRFECQGSGACCRNLSLGPLAQADVRRLETLDLASAFPLLGGASPVEAHALPDGGSAPFLRKVDGHCVFQLDDGRCGLHVRLGPEAKPLTCRLFPLEHVVRHDGIHVYDRGECSRFPASSRAGEPLVRTPQRLLPLMQQARRLEHPIVQLTDSLVVDHGYFAPLVQAAVDECAAPALTAPEVLRALGRRVSSFAAQIEQVGLAPAGPAALVQHVLATPRARFYVPCRPENLAPGCRAIARIAEALVAACDRVFEDIPEGHPQDYARGHARQLKPVLHFVRELTAALVEGRAAPERMILAGFVAVDPPEVHATLRYSLRQALFGRQALLDDRAPPALLRLAFVQLVTAFGARQQAAQDPSRTTVDALDAPHVVAVRGLSLDPLRRVFIEAAEAAPATLEALPYVVRWR